MSASWRDRRVLLGVTGGIAAYKAAVLTSKLVQAGADVHVIMTGAAMNMVAPATFTALTGHPVFHDLFDEPRLGRVDHVELAHWAEISLVVPATANIIGKLAAGIADDFLTTTLLGCPAPLVLAPAMEANMYNNPVVQENLDRLRRHGALIVEPGEGYLASGRQGVGRMAEPETIMTVAGYRLGDHPSLAGWRVLVSAGPTHEYIDPVRFISNPSSGKMGFAIAGAAAARGAQVTLVAGPVNLPTPPGVDRVDVVSAAEMHQAIEKVFSGGVDAVIMSAAVADYRPRRYLESKHKKMADGWVLELESTTDILAELGRKKTSEVLVGFAAETDRVEENALKKLRAKNLDMIVLNDITEPGAGFGTDTNRVRFFMADGTGEKLPLLSKEQVAQRILDHVHNLLAARNGVAGD